MWFTCYLQTSSINSKSIKSQDTHKHIPVLTFLFNLTCSKRTRLDRRILVLVSAPGNRICVEHRRVACRNTRYAPVFQSLWFSVAQRDCRFGHVTVPVFWLYIRRSWGDEWYTRAAVRALLSVCGGWRGVPLESLRGFGMREREGIWDFFWRSRRKRGSNLCQMAEI